MSDKAPQEMGSARWAGELGDKWNTFHDQFEGMIEEAGKAVIEYAEFQQGERVIDIGCGLVLPLCGLPTLLANQTISPVWIYPVISSTPADSVPVKKAAVFLGYSNLLTGYLTLIGHFKENQVGDLLYIITIPHAVVT